MNRHLVCAVVVAVLCCGCEAKLNQPPATSQEKSNSTKQPAISAGRDIRQQNESGASGGQAEYVSFPTAGVKLVRPTGFDDAGSFHGFQQPATQSSVLVASIPAPFAEMSAGFTAAQLKTRGMTLQSKESIEIDGMPGVLLSVAQTAQGMELAKWIVAFGNESETKLVTATFLRSESANLSDELKAVVLGTRIDNSPAPAPGTDVGFTIDASPKLKPARGIMKLLMYTLDGSIPAKSPEDPVFMAGPSLAAAPVDDKRAFAVQRLYQTAHTRIASITSNSEITIDGLDGYEIVADGEDVDSGTPLKVYQAILYDGGTYFMMQGLVGASVAEQYLGEFKTMARSLTRNPE